MNLRSSKSTAKEIQRAPKVSLLIDSGARVLNVDLSLAGIGFDAISADSKTSVHDQMHEGCDGDCGFQRVWKRAWRQLRTRDSIEWELQDTVIDRLLRFNLAHQLLPRDTDRSAQERNLLLTITDLTEVRDRYEALVDQQEALIRLLRGVVLRAEESGEPVDDVGETGHRLILSLASADSSFNRRLILAQEDERKRLASELHNGLAQDISSIKMKIETGIALASDQARELDLRLFEEAIAGLRDTVEEIRRLSRNLVPSILEDFGLAVAVESLCMDESVRTMIPHVSCIARVDESAVPDAIRIVIYRVVQEALNNAVKYSGSENLDVSLLATEDGIRLIVSDGGVGIDLDEVPGNETGGGGLGLRSMRERIEATGGHFDILSAPEKGVVISAEWSTSALRTDLR